MSQNGWETTIYTGNPATDQQTLAQHQQAAAAQGLDLQVQPLSSGGYHVRAVPRVSSASYGYAQPAYAGGMGADAPAVLNSGGGAAVAASDTPQRLAYIRKVYTLLAISCFLAITSGALAITVGPTATWILQGHKKIHVPLLVYHMLNTPFLMYGAFGLLFVATMGASAVSRVKGLNMVALFGVSILMGIELAPMVFVAQVLSGMGKTLSAAPVRDSFTLVGAIFVGITAYVYVTRKDFSYLGASLSMGFFVIFGASILAIAFRSEVFSLAVASAGALLAAGFLLYNTSRIFTHSSFDDPVGDALGLIVQLRNLFMWILRILMSSRR